MKSITVESPLTSIDVKSDGVTVTVGSTRGKVFVYDLRKAASPISVFSAHRSSVQRLKFENKTTVSTIIPSYQQFYELFTQFFSLNFSMLNVKIFKHEQIFA